MLLVKEKHIILKKYGLVVIKLPNFLLILSTFFILSPVWIYFDENVMVKNLLHISLTKFTKLKESAPF